MKPSDFIFLVYVPIGENWGYQQECQDIADLHGARLIGGTTELIYQCGGDTCRKFRETLIERGFAPHF